MAPDDSKIVVASHRLVNHPPPTSSHFGAALARLLFSTCAKFIRTNGVRQEGEAAAAVADDVDDTDDYGVNIGIHTDHVYILVYKSVDVYTTLWMEQQRCHPTDRQPLAHPPQELGMFQHVPIFCLSEILLLYSQCHPLRSMSPSYFSTQEIQHRLYPIQGHHIHT